jgi:hypothetical protein
MKVKDELEWQGKVRGSGANFYIRKNHFISIAPERSH